MRFPSWREVVSFAVLLLHFTLVELRPLLVFYSGFRGGIVNEMVFLGGSDQALRRSNYSDIGAELPDEFQVCVLSDASSALSLWNLPAVEKIFEKRAETCMTSRNTWAWLHFSCLLVVGIFALFLIRAVREEHNLMKEVDAAKQTVSKEDATSQWPRFDFYSGYYLNFTNKMERRWWYRFVAWAIVVYTSFAVPYMVYIGWLAYEFRYLYISTQMLSILQMMYAAWRLTIASSNRATSTGSKSFKLLRFERSVRDMILQPNDAFLMKLETAVYRGLADQPEHLHNMLNFNDVCISITKCAGCEDLVDVKHDKMDPNKCGGCQELYKALRKSTDKEYMKDKKDGFLCPNIRTLEGGRTGTGHTYRGGDIEESLLQQQN